MNGLIKLAVGGLIGYVGYKSYTTSYTLTDAICKGGVKTALADIAAKANKPAAGKSTAA